MTLTTWLPTILALVGAAVAWGAFQARLDALSAALTSHRSDAADRDRSSAAKLDKLLDQQGTLVQRLVLIEANREHDRDKAESQIEATRAVVDALSLRVDALERATRHHHTGDSP